jgi:hypothetical protein
MIHQNMPDHLGGDCEKVSPVLPPQLLLPAEPNIHFVDQRGALKSPGVTFLLKKIVGETPQFVVDDWNKIVQRP